MEPEAQVGVSEDTVPILSRPPVVPARAGFHIESNHLSANSVSTNACLGAESDPSQSSSSDDPGRLYGHIRPAPQACAGEGTLHV